MAWIITIKGDGDVHKEAEADKHASAFVEHMKSSGVNVTAATFTHEARDVIEIDKLSGVQAP